MGSKQDITIASDASLDHHTTGDGGFAFIIYNGSTSTQVAAKFKSKPRNIIEAEILSILNAMSILIKKQTPIKKLTIQCDNKFFVDKALTDEIKNKWAEPTKSALQMFRYMVKLINCETLEVVHVKGHTDDTSLSAMLNNWCDTAAVAARKS